uniref:TSA: Wollemia nobilis Ref_Wollemi_Transcript_1377_664 transcribed RNA sequence n=1 Tax=Wollemia nobilis TaxID=56998 RepID=A0A0C9RZ44_9CONI
MGPQSPEFEAWGKLLSSVLSDRAFKDSDDQSALVYLLLKEKEKWADKMLVEHGYYLNGYWVEIVGTYENMTERYEAMEREHPILKQRHAEKMKRDYAEIRKPYLGLDESGDDAAYEINKKRRRAFVTHFTGCEPCSGDHNKKYNGEKCWKAMERALNFADNQVLKHYGFRHDNLSSSHVTPIS